MDDEEQDFKYNVLESAKEIVIGIPNEEAFETNVIVRGFLVCMVLESIDLHIELDVRSTISLNDDADIEKLIHEFYIRWRSSLAG